MAAEVAGGGRCQTRPGGEGTLLIQQSVGREWIDGARGCACLRIREYVRVRGVDVVGWSRQRHAEWDGERISRQPVRQWLREAWQTGLTGRIAWRWSCSADGASAQQYHGWLRAPRRHSSHPPICQRLSIRHHATTTKIDLLAARLRLRFEPIFRLLHRRPASFPTPFSQRIKCTDCMFIDQCWFTAWELMQAHAAFILVSRFSPWQLKPD